MRTNRYLIALLLGAWSLSGCSKDDTAPTDTPDPMGTITQTFPMEDPAAPESRTAVGSDGVIGFTASETMSAFVWSGTTSANASAATRTVVNGVPQITVTHQEIEGAADYDYLFVSPESNGAEIDAAFNTLTVHLNARQTPTAASFDPAQDVLVSRKQTAAAPSTQTTLASVVFKRLFTFFRLVIDPGVLSANGIAFGSDERIVSVTLTAPEGTVLAGTATVAVSDDYNQSIPVFSQQEVSNSVTADYGQGAALGQGAFDVWLVVNPADFTGLDLRIETSAQTITQRIKNTPFAILPDKINTMTLRGVNNSNVTTTVTVNSYFAHGVTIDGTTYDHTNGTLLTATQDLTPLSLGSGGVRFLDADADGYAFEVTNASNNNYLTANTVLIGNDAARKTRLNLRTQIHLRNSTGIFAFKNLEIDATAKVGSYNQILTVSGAGAGGAGTLLFEDCDIAVSDAAAFFSTYSSSNSDASLGNIVFRNCKIRFESINNANTYALFNIGTQITTGLAGFKTLVFENNVIYAPTTWTNPAVSLFSQAPAAAQTTDSLSDLAITFDHNTVGNVIGYGSATPGSAYFIVGQFASATVTGNLFLNTSDKYPSILRVGYDYQTWPVSTFRDNFAQTGATFKGFYDGSGAYYPTPAVRIYNTDGVFTSYDLDSGIFSPAPAYAAYGSTRR